MTDLDEVAKAAHRSQFVHAALADMVWTAATDDYRRRWRIIAAAAGAKALRLVHSEIASRPGLADVADLIDARADELLDPGSNPVEDGAR